MIKTVGEFVDLVFRMREAQQQFIKTHALGDLSASKLLEKQVDEEIEGFMKRREEKNQPALGI
jgi:hypothetical protein